MDIGPRRDSHWGSICSLQQRFLIPEAAFEPAWTGHQSSHRAGPPYFLSGALVVVAVLTAGFSFFSPGVLTGAPVAIGCLRGTALVILVVGLPVLATAMARTTQGSARGLVVWWSG